MKTQKKKFVKTCFRCGKTFLTRSGGRKYCSKGCKMDAQKERDDSVGQPCWRCKNATGKCSWSMAFVPVEGWNAKPTVIGTEDGRNIDTYEIISCPQFARG